MEDSDENKGGLNPGRVDSCHGFRTCRVAELYHWILNRIGPLKSRKICGMDSHRNLYLQPNEVNGEYIDYIGTSNLTFSPVTEFIIFGFPSLQRYQTLLFCVFLIIYLFTVTGNGTIFLLVMLDKQLQTPMYFFVSNLSFLDMSYTSVTVPKMLAKFLMNMDTISYTGCFMQMYFFLSLTAAECLLLAVMAYDRYLAICCPLHYHTIMTRRLYIFLSTAAWTGGFATPVTILILALRLPFCGPNIIHHYYCDHPPLLQLACTDTSFNVSIGSPIGAFIILISFSLVAISYIKIILSILKIASNEGRRKTFSTCASHFVVVNMFYLPLIFMYIRPTASYSSDVDSLVAMMYTVLTPMMNPVIYSMRNKDIKNAFLKKICSRRRQSNDHSKCGDPSLRLLLLKINDTLPIRKSEN
ncbi:olfactory receptor 6N1-like [Ascaphus truei]|uniref:olfactory receptor 6N1-like n=1 Tax=Ascaphus truei TaxID=8439 RepID=UPI003F5A2DAB